MKTKTWVLLVAAVLTVLTVLAVAVMHLRPAGHIANIYQNDVCIRSIDLDMVLEPYSFTVTDQAGHENVVLVEPGRIRVSEANCPDQVCVNTGWISNSVKPIVCLPAKLIIRLEAKAEKADEPVIDAVVG